MSTRRVAWLAAVVVSLTALVNGEDLTVAAAADLQSAMQEIGARFQKETGKTVTQVSLNWLLQRPTVSSVIIGARDEPQLKENLGAVGWNLTPEQVARLDKVSQTDTIYPYWHQRGFTERNPVPTKLYNQ